MKENGSYTYSEILSQPEAWGAALEVLQTQGKQIADLWDSEQFSQVIFTGCGSTFYLALAAAALFQGLTGQPARGVPASECWLYPQSVYIPNQRSLLIAVSRSGETSETLRACEAFKANGNGRLLTLSCYAEMPLASMGDVNLVFPSGAEKSVAQTRAFSTLYLATIYTAAECAGRADLLAQLPRLPEAGKTVLQSSKPLAEKTGPDMSIDRFYFLGSGPRYGLACELSLKMKEMTLSHSEPFHFMEFRHGPKSMITPSALVIGLLSEKNREAEAAVLAEMESMGGRVLRIGEQESGVSFGTGLAEEVRNILFLPVGQLIAYHRSMARGLNPDQPHQLEAVVRL